MAFSYDAAGQLLSEDSSTGNLGYRYDELGNLIHLELPDGRKVNHLYYGSCHLHQIVSVRPSHLPNSSIKGDGVRVFLSGRDRPYRKDFHAPTKLLPQTVQSPGPPGMPATRSDDFQRSHTSWH
nr:RHS repeat domain-containing protein [Pseudomonas fluorescens]